MAYIKILLDLAHVHLDMAKIHAKLARESTDDESGMVHDHFYAEHMAYAMFYLTHARKSRLIKERKTYGYQF